MSRRSTFSGKLLEKVKLYWFVIALMISMVLAQMKPDIGRTGGPLYPEITVKFGAVAVIYFLTGLSLNSTDVKQTIQNLHLHLFIQIFTFLFVPLTIRGLAFVLQRVGVDEWILKGLITMSTMPPPISSAAIMTRAVGGNEAAAVINSALGSLLGIIFTPAALLLFLGSSTVIPVRSSILQLVASVFFPFVLGQSVRAIEMFKDSDIPISSVSLTALLFIIFSTFCDVFSEQDSAVDPINLLLTVLLAVVIQLTLMFLAWTFSGLIGNFTTSDRAAITFCCTHKSLTLGLPILRILFAGYSHFTSVSLPLLIYHPSQMILAIFLITEMKPILQIQKQSEVV